MQSRSESPVRATHAVAPAEPIASRQARGCRTEPALQPVASAAMEVAAIALLMALLVPTTVVARRHEFISVPEFIAHAGGARSGVGYTNSREALDENYARGHRVFELDFCWTSDHRLALIHDWQGVWTSMFEAEAGTPTLDRFLATPTRSGFSQLSLDTLLDWMRAHPDAFVVTDVKERNLDALREIARVAGPLRNSFIPQIYTPEEFDPARELGFDRIVFTVYRSGMDAAQTVSFARGHALWALTVSEHVAQHWDLSEILEARSPPIFVHTINSTADFQRLKDRGFHGVYTDRLPE